MLEFNKDEIYIINSSNDKPLKIIHGNDISTHMRKYRLTLKEVLLNELREMWSQNKITSQQYKSEKGKLRKGMLYYEQVLNCLIKKGITKEYIDKEVKRERDGLVFTQKYNINSFLPEKFGIINIP